MTSVVDTFLHDRDNLIPGSIPYRLSSYINRNYRLYCIVEGSTDISFYSNLKHINLKDNVCYLYGKSNVEGGGKETVISSFNIIKNIDKFKKYLDKYIFVIDHDYMGLSSTKININSNLVNSFSITKPYSFENYFLKEYNIKIIFDYLNIQDDYENFINLFNRFANEIKEYTRLKSSTIAVQQINNTCYDQYCFPYKKKYSYDDIFNFNFKNGRFEYNRNYLYEEVNSMRNYINNPNNYKANEYYRIYSYELVLNNDFIRGHNAFDFLARFLIDRHDIDISETNKGLYNTIVKLLDVDIEFMNALGKKIN